jgi:hypothetical protein
MICKRQVKPTFFYPCAHVVVHTQTRYSLKQKARHVFLKAHYSKKCFCLLSTSSYVCHIVWLSSWLNLLQRTWFNHWTSGPMHMDSVRNQKSQDILNSIHHCPSQRMSHRHCLPACWSHAGKKETHPPPPCKVETTSTVVATSLQGESNGWHPTHKIHTPRSARLEVATHRRQNWL